MFPGLEKEEEGRILEGEITSPEILSRRSRKF